MNRDTDIAMWQTFLASLKGEENDDFASALDCVWDEFGEEPKWLVEVYLGTADPCFAYSDGVTVNFKEITL